MVFRFSHTYTFDYNTALHSLFLLLMSDIKHLDYSRENTDIEHKCLQNIRCQLVNVSS